MHIGAVGVGQRSLIAAAVDRVLRARRVNEFRIERTTRISLTTTSL